MSDSSLRRWDIAVLPFPYIDQAREKKRPALIVSDTQFHEAFGTCWVMMITGAKKSSWPCDIPIRNIETTGLPIPCVIRPAKLASADLGRIQRAK